MCTVYSDKRKLYYTLCTIYNQVDEDNQWSTVNNRYGGNGIFKERSEYETFRGKLICEGLVVEERFPIDCGNGKQIIQKGYRLTRNGIIWVQFNRQQAAILPE